VLPLILTLAAIAFSAVVGAVTTVVHQSHVLVGSVDVPWGLALSLIVVVAWMVGLLLVGISRWGLMVSGLVLLGAVYLLSQRGPGGSVLVPDSWVGNAWVVAVPLVIVVVIFWPRLPRRRPVDAGAQS
jgi:N-acetyl-1-D-myo-inositol-2-amino-2-deoxy-alpha-D-glucopyranoside deacetylase